MIDLGVGRLVGDLVGDLGTLRDRALDRQLNVAVTGLRRSGKTVFITAVVHHLIDGRGLPFLEAVHDGRYLGAELMAVRDGRRFPFEAFQAALSASPSHWPAATQELTTLRLGLRYRSDHTVLRHVQPLQSLNLEIIDYPGEWLLDLPLMSESFESFSAQALEQAHRPPRSAIASEWIERARQLDQAASADDTALSLLAGAFGRYLQRAQSELGLSLVQPGRFTNPGPHAGSELLRFAPLPPARTLPGSTRALAIERFEGYREQIVRRFYEDHFRRFDRQIVLVDLLSCLNAGPAHFHDTQRALELILGSFRYGRSSWLGRLLAPRIDKVLFVASKADHVAPSQHAALKQLLELMIRPASTSARLLGLEPDVLALAALRCTDTVKTVHHGQTLSCLKGRLKSDERETVLFPGEVPPELPSAEDWPEDRFRFRDFAPRPLRTGEAGQHIRLDQAAQYLIGDKLR